MDDEWVDVPPQAVSDGVRGEPNWLARMLGLGQLADEAKKPSPFTLKDELTNAGGVAGGAATMGAGALIGALADGESPVEAAKSGAVAFAVPKAIEKGIGAVRKPVANLLRRGAVRSMKAAVKPDRGYLEKMAGSKRGGIAKMETEIAETALDEGVNPVRRSGMDKLQGKIEGVAAERTGRINSAPDVPVAKSGRRAMAGGRLTRRVMARGDAPQDDMAVVEKFLEDLKNSPRTSEEFVQGVTFENARPVRAKQGQVSFTGYSAPSVSGQSQMLWQGRPALSAQVGGATTRAANDTLRAVPGEAKRRLKDLTPKELADTIEAGNDRLRGLFNGQSKNAEVQARLNVQRARTRSLDEAANTGELSNKMRKLIDLRNVGNIATRRAESNNPISLTDVISFSAGRPAVAAGSIGMKAPVLADIAGALNRAGKSVGTPSERAEALRRILVAYLANQGGDK